MTAFILHSHRVTAASLRTPAQAGECVGTDVCSVTTCTAQSECHMAGTCIGLNLCTNPTKV